MIEDIELETLINEVYEYYGFDFGSYSRASLKDAFTEYINSTVLNIFMIFFPEFVQTRNIIKEWLTKSR